MTLDKTFSATARRLRNIVCVAIASVSLAGCYDVQTTLTFKPDGTSAISGRMDFPRDAEHVARFYGSLMQLYSSQLQLPPQASQLFRGNLCEALGNVSQLNPVPAQRLDLQSREYRTEERYGCAMVYQAGDTSQLIDRMAMASVSSMGVFQTTREGPRRVRVEINFNNMPDVTKVAPGLIMLGMLQQQSRRPGRPLKMPSPQAISEVTKDYIEASLAMARLTAPNNHLQLAIHAPKIVETNGEQKDGLVTFRWTWEEFTRLILKPQSAKGGKRSYAVVEY